MNSTLIELGLSSVHMQGQTHTRIVGMAYRACVLIRGRSVEVCLCVCAFRSIANRYKQFQCVWLYREIASLYGQKERSRESVRGPCGEKQAREGMVRFL